MIPTEAVQTAIATGIGTITSPSAITGTIDITTAGPLDSALPVAWVRVESMSRMVEDASGLYKRVREFPVWLYVAAVAGKGHTYTSTDATATKAWLDAIAEYFFVTEQHKTATGLAFKVTALTDTAAIGVFSIDSKRRYIGAILTLQIETQEQRGN